MLLTRLKLFSSGIKQYGYIKEKIVNNTKNNLIWLIDAQGTSTIRNVKNTLLLSEPQSLKCVVDYINTWPFYTIKPDKIIILGLSTLTELSEPKHKYNLSQLLTLTKAFSYRYTIYIELLEIEPDLTLEHYRDYAFFNINNLNKTI